MILRFIKQFQILNIGFLTLSKCDTDMKNVQTFQIYREISFDKMLSLSRNIFVPELLFLRKRLVDILEIYAALYENY